MKNNPQLKTVKSEAPKTPGGISKSLLTPCRRVGLSRNWKKAGPSPFISPIPGSASPKVEVKVEKKESRKRKERVESEENEDQCPTETPITSDGVLDVDESDIECKVINDDLPSTPTRHIEAPQKKKSKTLLSALSKNFEDESISPNKSIVIQDASNQKDNTEKESKNVVLPLQKCKSKGKKITSPKNTTLSKENSIENAEPVQLQDSNALKKQDDVVVPVQKSKSKEKKNISIKSSPTCKKKEENSYNMVKELKENIDSSKNQLIQNEKEVKPSSPKELTKECIVVIQKKIFKTDKKKKEKARSKNMQVDSDSDDVPLGQLNKEKPVPSTQNKTVNKSKIEQPETPNVQEIINLDDEDFEETKKPKIKKLEDKATSIGGLKKKPKTKSKPNIPKSFQTQNDCDDDDDFDFDNKKTILIRKTYEKVIKPQKAKSTGSITQRDIDELRARIEAKKKMLLARAMTEDTEELRTLIKKWQKGCQDALIELMELMKTKFPDKQNMDYSEMLSMLKIPTNLVGYDAENDCFTTPEDENIILSQFNE